MKPSPPLVDTGRNIAQIWGQWRRRLSRSNQSSRSLAQGMDEVKSKRSRPARSCRLQKDCLFLAQKSPSGTGRRNKEKGAASKM